VGPISRIADTDSSVAAWMPAICWLISTVAFAVSFRCALLQSI
jgi:hypothetical protein